MKTNWPIPHSEVIVNNVSCRSNFLSTLSEKCARVSARSSQPTLQILRPLLPMHRFGHCLSLSGIISLRLVVYFLKKIAADLVRKHKHADILQLFPRLIRFVSTSHIPSGSTHRATWYYDDGRDIDTLASPTGNNFVLNISLGDTLRVGLLIRVTCNPFVVSVAVPFTVWSESQFPWRLVLMNQRGRSTL